MDDHVIVPAGSVLRIKPGSTFVVIGRYRFGADRAGNDSGSIEAIGTESNPIVFRGATKDTRWYGLAFIHAESVVLEHVTIQDAWKDDDNKNQRLWRRGGALASVGIANGTVIRHCTFKNNYARDVGGAIDVNSTTLEITNSRFEANHTSNNTTKEYGGGAIRFHHIASKNVRRNVFLRNRTAGYGGALAHFDSSIELHDNQFIENEAGLGSGAIRCSGGRGFTFGNAANSYWGNVFRGNKPDIGCGIDVP